MGKLDLFSIRATAKKIHKREIMLKLSAVVALVSVTILLVFYGLIIFANSIGNFTVKIAEEDEQYAISICENSSFDNPTTLLHADVLDSMDNITESWITEDVDNIDGAHNGKNYIAYTFYVKNVGSKPIDYKTEIEILSVKKNADEAVRVKVYKNGEATVYAKRQKNSELPEPDTTPFYSNKMVMSQMNNQFLAGDIDKYTIVIWLEGNDPECIDNIRGGQVRMVMHLEVFGLDD